MTGKPENMHDKQRKQRVTALVTAYPFVLLSAAVVLNLTVLGVQPVALALPTEQTILALTISAALLLINHTWLMTSTELTRVVLGISATPEDALENGSLSTASSFSSHEEITRRQNAHRNLTENAVYFPLLVMGIATVSPSQLAVTAWLLGFSIGRVGHTYGYLTKSTSVRGISMSLSLLSLYGIAGYLLIALIPG